METPDLTPLPSAARQMPDRLTPPSRIRHPGRCDSLCPHFQADTLMLLADVGQPETQIPDMCSPPATRTRARLRRRTELESMQSPAGSAATAPQSPNMAAPAAVSHIVPIGVFNTRLAVSFLAFLWAVCLTPVLFDGSAYTVSTMGDKLTRGMRRLDPRVRQASELRVRLCVLDACHCPWLVLI